MHYNVAAYLRDACRGQYCFIWMICSILLFVYCMWCKCLLQISEIVGVKLHVTEESSLNDMIEAGLPKFTNQLEEISAAATKEYALEKNLQKMKEEWQDICFECVLYRYVLFFLIISFFDCNTVLVKLGFTYWQL